MIKPNKLKKSDRIGLIGPSSPVPDGRLELAVKSLEEMGLIVVVGESCGLRHGYLSGKDEIRAKDINDMFRNKEINGVFCIRGGYGAQRLMDMVDFDMIRDNPKVFSGFSDITVLHNMFNQYCGFISYHSPMAGTGFYRGLDDYTMNSFYKNIFYDEPVGIVSNPEGEEIKTLVSGQTQGILTGGNLSLMATSIGTFYEIETKGRILLIEEVDEEPYKVDKMLLQLRNSGKLHDCAGIILGSFTGCVPQEHEYNLELEEIFNEVVKPVNKPTVYNVKCGHGTPTMTVPLGAELKLDATNGVLEFL